MKSVFFGVGETKEKSNRLLGTVQSEKEMADIFNERFTAILSGVSYKTRYPIEL